MKTKVISLRLDPEQMKQLEELANEEKKERSALTRELISYGLMLKLFKLYRQGRVSLGYLAEKLSLSVGEILDLLVEFGIESPIDYEDYLKGFEALKGIFPDTRRSRR